MRTLDIFTAPVVLPKVIESAISGTAEKKTVVKTNKLIRSNVGFYFENFDAEEDDLAKFINLIRPLYYKRFAT